MPRQTNPDPEEQEQLEVLKRALTLVAEHRNELSREATSNTNPVHAFVELVQHRWLDKKEFEKLLGKGFFERWVKEYYRKTPENSAAIAHLRQLRKKLRQEMWQEVNEGKRPHPLDVVRTRK